MDERQCERLIADFPVKYRLGDCEREGYLHNIGADGCMIAVGDAELEAGTRITVQFGSAHSVTGYVVWLREGHAGISFEQPLERTVLIRLGVPENAYDMSCKTPKDRFGRTLPPLSH